MKNNNITSPKEKLEIIQRFKNDESAIQLAKEIGIDRKRIYVWLEKYEKDGLKGLESKT